MNEVCSKIYKWAELMMAQLIKNKEEGWGEPYKIEALRTVRLMIEKSCLLDRMINCGEKPSKTPCPVHKGKWSGWHGTWPDEEKDITLSSGKVVELRADKMLQEWYDQGCRCYKHKCGCTTGWQPDEHCGCL